MAGGGVDILSAVPAVKGRGGFVGDVDEGMAATCVGLDEYLEVTFRRGLDNYSVYPIRSTEDMLA